MDACRSHLLDFHRNSDCTQRDWSDKGVGVGADATSAGQYRSRAAAMLSESHRTGWRVQCARATLLDAVQ